MVEIAEEQFISRPYEAPLPHRILGGICGETAGGPWRNTWGTSWKLSRVIIGEIPWKTINNLWISEIFSKWVQKCLLEEFMKKLKHFLKGSQEEFERKKNNRITERISDKKPKAQKNSRMNYWISSWKIHMDNLNSWSNIHTESLEKSLVTFLEKSLEDSLEKYLDELAISGIRKGICINSVEIHW